MFFIRALALAAAVCLPAFPQEITGTISGTVTDASGAVVPGASVSVINAATSVIAFRGQSNESGNYAAPSLPAGTYRVVVEMQGFKKAEIQGVRLQVDQRARIDVSLQPGEVAETITVVGEGLGRWSPRVPRSEPSSTPRRSATCRCPTATY